MSDGLNDEILQELSAEISKGEVSIIEEKNVYDSIRDSFPISMGRIDWTRVVHHKHLRCTTHPDSEQPLPQDMADFFNSFFDELRIDKDSSVFVMNDDAYSIAFQMKIHVLIRVLPIVLSYPQHTYIISEDSHWCFQYTWEQDLYWGINPKHLKENGSGPTCSLSD